MGNLFAKKSLDRLMHEAEEVGEHSLKRSLGWINLVALGIGGIIGAGLFIRTAAAIADRAGPSVVLAFIVFGIGCTFAGLCYAEFASLIRTAHSISMVALAFRARPNRDTRHDEHPGTIHPAATDSPAYPRHQGIGFRQRSYRDPEGEHRVALHRHRL